MKRLPKTTAIKWLFLVTFYLLLFAIAQAKIYKSCEETRLEIGSSAVDGYYSIELANGVATSLYCKGMDTEEPKEYLNLPAGKSNNYALIYSNKGAPNDCHGWRPVQMYNESGKSEFEKIRFDTGTSGILLDDFTFARKIGLNHVKYGTAGDYFASNKKCQPRGNFRIDLAGTPFIISKKIKWFWKGNFYDGSSDGTPILNQNLYVGCFVDKSQRAMPSALMRYKRMTLSRCKSHCKYRKFYYAGLEAGQECWCGNSYSKYGPSKGCRMRCTGNRREICGGSWALSVYVVGQPQFMTGRCGGYPGYCYPAQIHDKDSHLLLLDINPKHPCYGSVCGPFATCLAIDTMGYQCLCPKGFIGKNCEKRTEITSTNGSCPPKYQPEVCRCASSNCFGAKFQNGRCITLGGKPQVVCRYGDPSHIHISTVTSGSYPSARCPYDTKTVSCSYWDVHKKTKSNGVSGTRMSSRSCSYYRCRRCSVQVQCMKYTCGCKNGGKCDVETRQCHCLQGYTGELCENYDYCSFWETSHKRAACGRSGICRSVPQVVVSTIGGDEAGDRCLFPFKYQGQTFSRCISDNKVGPPFACATSFNGRSGYIDLGKWSPGPTYTILAWVKPTFQDSKNRLIVGSISDCRDFGIGFQYGRFQIYYATMAKARCTVSVSTFNDNASLNKWHSVAVMNSGRMVTLMVDGKIWSSRMTYSHFLGNVKGFFIGGGPYNYGSSFKGSIKNVKIYNKALRTQDAKQIFQKRSADDILDEVKRGLVGYYELGEKMAAKCNGIDHGFQDWIPETLDQISGVHCNISKFMIQKGTKVFVARWNGTSGGSLEVSAQEIHIDGELTAAGAGYHGGKPSNGNGADGMQGESHSDTGGTDVNGNRGAGGGGLGEKQSTKGGLPGGGGGYASAGTAGLSKISKQGTGAGGAVYGTRDMHYMYLGSGGGSGGNAIDLTQTPLGGAGGNGGGAIKLYAEDEVIISGTINVQGEDGIGDAYASCFSCPASCKGHQGACMSPSSSYCWDKSGPGGGGSGGSIYISGEMVNIGKNRLFAMGGNGGRGAYMCGGSGGFGRIYIQYSSFVGSLDRRYGQMNRASRKDKIKDFSHIGHTVGNDEIPINSNPVYLGCIKETKDFLLKHKLDLSPFEAKTLTPLSCHSLCNKASHIYSGTTNGDQCYCDDHVTTTSYVPDNECDSPCPGDKRQFCGGDSKVLVFGPRPNSYARRITGAVVKCESWCVTADRDAEKPKWGQCTDEENILSMSIACECPQGKIGEECTEDCPQGTWGVSCRNNCTCNGHPCDTFNGNCNCTEGFYGNKCNRKRCKQNTGGFDCKMCLIRNHYGESCQQCDCVSSSCDRRTGKCYCASGRMGDKCEKVCSTDRWGPNCYRHCSCYNNATCEPIYGMCSCPPGYAGRRCNERCPAGTYGDRCASSCPICQTDTCHHMSGNCLCDSGYKGINCTEPCSSGTWGVGCAKSCDQDCKNGCNPMEGFCCTKAPCSYGQYCNKDGDCIGEITDGEVEISPVKSSSLGAGSIIGIVLVVILFIMAAICGTLYFLKGKAIFNFSTAKYETQKDDVVLSGNFENPFYERMSDASKPGDTKAANSETE